MKHIQMLLKARDQFAFYARQHAAKQTPEADEKARVNEAFVAEIDAVLAETPADVLTATANFADIAYADGISDKNRQTQIGVHFEEVAEMIDSLRGTDTITIEYLGYAEGTLKRLATHLKNSEAGRIVIHDRLGFLDACCDQLVTATLSAKLQGMDPVGGLIEVNRSNYSKLVDGVMLKVPVTFKWLKGPDYTEPNLAPFI